MNTADMHIPSNKVRDIERYICAELAGLYPDGELRMFSRMLFEAFLGWDCAQLLLQRDATVNQSDLLRFHWAVEDLKRFRPIQHIIGWTEFCGCRIEVNESVLIPRPETEEIVNRTINQLSKFKIDSLHSISKKRSSQPSAKNSKFKIPNSEVNTPYSKSKIQNSKFKILDLCTGSGCIAIALAKQWPEAEVTAVDISDKALAVAKKNAASNNVKINFIQADILSQFTIQNSEFNIIISNPPYVMDSERAAMQRNVLDWEPASALFVPDGDPLQFYRAIAVIAKRHLSHDGIVVLEINENLPAETEALFVSKDFQTEICGDFRGKSRMLVATQE